MTDLIERARSKSPYLRDSSAERLIDELVGEIERIQRDDAIIAELEKAAREFIADVEATVATLRRRYAIEEAA